jgi:hypothetical protein
LLANRQFGVKLAWSKALRVNERAWKDEIGLALQYLRLAKVGLDSFEAISENLLGGSYR